MAFNPLSGRSASVLIGSVPYAFDAWKPTISNKLGEVSNFTGGGFRQFVGGLSDGRIQISGPYDEGNMAFTVGNSYVLILGYNNTVNLTVTALLEKIEPDVKVDDAIRVSLTFQSNGSFACSIV